MSSEWRVQLSFGLIRAIRCPAVAIGDGRTCVACMCCRSFACVGPDCTDRNQLTGPGNIRSRRFLFNFTSLSSGRGTPCARRKTSGDRRMGEDTFGVSLDDTVRGEAASGRPLIVERYRVSREIGGTDQVLLYSPVRRPTWEEELASLVAGQS